MESNSLRLVLLNCQENFAILLYNLKEDFYELRKIWDRTEDKIHKL